MKLLALALLIEIPDFYIPHAKRKNKNIYTCTDEVDVICIICENPSDCGNVYFWSVFQIAMAIFVPVGSVVTSILTRIIDLGSFLFLVQLL